MANTLTDRTLLQFADAQPDPRASIKAVLDAEEQRMGKHRGLSAEEYEAALSPSGKYVPPSDGHVIAEVIDGVVVDRRG